jgi:hypothetical protein
MVYIRGVSSSNVFKGLAGLTVEVGRMGPAKYLFETPVLHDAQY